MYQKFEIIRTETDLFDRKINVELSFAPDESSITKDTIYVGEEKTGRILDFNLNIVGNIIEILLLEWPKPNVEYNLFVQKGIKSISEEELDASLRRNLIFKSDITSTVLITSPSDNEKIKSLDIAWTEKSKDPNNKLIFSYYIEIASDNAFFNIEKTSKVIQKQSISLTDVENGQHFVRIRAQEDEVYGLWGNTVTFYFGDSKSSDQTNPGSSSSSNNDPTAPILDIDVLSAPNNGVTPTSAVFLLDQDIDASSIKDLSIYNETSAIEDTCTYTVNGRTLTIIPTTAFADNMTYKITIGSLSSISGNRILENFVYVFATAMSPMYATVLDVNSIVSAFKISSDRILYYIHQASLMVDWINSQSAAGSTKLTAPYDFDVVQFTKYKAAKDALLSACMDKADSDGSKGTLLDISFEFSNGSKGLKDLLKELDKQVMYWQEAMRGYGPEGRQKPLYAVKASKSTPTTNSVSNLSGSLDRSNPMAGGF